MIGTGALANENCPLASALADLSRPYESWVALSGRAYESWGRRCGPLGQGAARTWSLPLWAARAYGA